MATWDCDPVTADEADTLDALFRARVRRTPTAVAYSAYDRQRQGWRDYRWREIGQAVQQWQQALRQVCVSEETEEFADGVCDC